MSNSRLFAGACVWLLILIGQPTSAALIDRGGGLIYDDDLNITWLQNANYLGTVEMEWQQAMDWAAIFSYYDSVRNVTYSDWRLPRADPVCGLQLRCYDSELGYLYYREPGFNEIFENFQGWKYWVDTIYPGSAPFAYNFNFLTGRQEVNSIYVDYIDVWVMRDGDVAAVPLPAAVWLFGSGLFGLIEVARRRASG